MSQVSFFYYVSACPELCADASVKLPDKICQMIYNLWNKYDLPIVVYSGEELLLLSSHSLLFPQTRYKHILH
jgi:hypothetical protein